MLLNRPGDVLAAIAAGGALGSLARWAVGLALPHRPGELAVSTWIVNVTGALVIGALMHLITEVWPPRRLVRPFWGIGVLGGYTTFSTYALDMHHLLAAGEMGRAVVYYVGTVLTGLLAVWLGLVAARAVGNRPPRTRRTE
jgi:CrcB protein